MTKTEITQAKAALRRQVEDRLRQMELEARLVAGRRLCEAMRRHAFWRDARQLLCFAPMPGEIDIWPLVLSASREGKCVALPRYDRAAKFYTVHVIRSESDVVPGFWGIREPAADCPSPKSDLLDLIIVPGVAFNESGWRLGRGKGYYDRLLKAWRGRTCGVCYDEQMVEHIPVEPHDIQLDCILTPTRYFQPGGSE